MNETVDHGGAGSSDRKHGYGHTAAIPPAQTTQAQRICTVDDVWIYPHHWL